MLDLRNLRYAVTLARRLSFARAAEELGISQPALTRAIQMLEQRFEVRLFDRDRSGVRLTPQGKVMLDGASILLANADDVERQWDRTAKGHFGRVRFGMAPMPARVLLPGALLERIETAPGVINDVVVRNVEALWPLLTAGDIEFFVAAEGQVPDTMPVRAEMLGRFPRSLIVRVGHPLLAGGQDESCFPVLVSGGVRTPRSQELEGPADRPRHVIEDFETLVRLTAATDAIWHASAYAVETEIAQGLLAAIPWTKTDDSASFRMVMYSLDRRTLSAAAKSFAKLFRSRIRELAMS
ncbi:MAG: LysR family transcriptional regulator [Sphingomonadales bacterium]|nr:MAG: LysR family transcriptional regulator [Sphingomonadales bacterium]